MPQLARAKEAYGRLLGVEQYADQPYYVGFRVGTGRWAWTPTGYSAGMAGPIGHYHVDDIQKPATPRRRGQVQRPAKDVGEGKLIAWVKHTNGNLLGLIQSP